MLKKIEQACARRRLDRALAAMMAACIGAMLIFLAGGALWGLPLIAAAVALLLRDVLEQRKLQKIMKQAVCPLPRAHEREVRHLELDGVAPGWAHVLLVHMLEALGRHINADLVEVHYAGREIQFVLTGYSGPQQDYVLLSFDGNEVRWGSALGERSVWTSDDVSRAVSFFWHLAQIR